AGEPDGSSRLDSLRSKIDSDHLLDSITFDTFGWDLSQNRNKFRRWLSENATLAERFFPGPPDFRSLNATQIREDMVEAQDLIEAPSFTIEDLDLPEWFGKLSTDVPEQISLLDVECFEIQPAQCVLAMQRHRIHSNVHY